MPRPTQFPDFATTDVVDGTSGQNNVAAPSGPKILQGWDYREKPPRQWMNWLHRFTGFWVRWFDELLESRTASATPDSLMLRDASGRAKVSDPDVDGDIANKGYVDGLVKVTAEVWALYRGVFSGQSFLLTGEQTAPHGIFISPDGTKLYSIGAESVVHQYTLASPSQIATATYDSVSFSVVAEDTNTRDVSFSDDGAVMYIVGRAGDNIYQYTLSTPWDLSTASYDSVTLSIAAQDIDPGRIAFGDSGSKLYLAGTNTSLIYQYSLSTPWDLSTASYDSVSFSPASQEGSPTTVAIKSDGTKLYVAGTANNTVYQYSLPTPWVLTGAIYDSTGLDFSSQDTIPQKIIFKPNGAYMYMVGVGSDSAHQYKTGFVEIL